MPEPDQDDPYRALDTEEDRWIREALAAEPAPADPDQETLRQIALEAKPLPTGLAEAWSEWVRIRARATGRGPLFPSPTVLRIYQIRAARLTDLLLYELEPARLADVKARLDCLVAVMERDGGPAHDAEALRRLIKRLRADLGAIEEPPPVPPVPAAPVPVSSEMTTATQRRAAVVSHLCDTERSRWSDREIARACGVSPQTVGNWRRKLSGEFGQNDPDETSRVYQRGGRTHVMNTARIGTARDKTPQNPV